MDIDPSDMAIKELGLPTYTQLHQRVKELEAALRALTTNRFHDFLCQCAEDWEHEHAAFARAKTLVGDPT